ncbi:MAG: preprotein translocase subunit SecE [Candidatus Latescibacteria bacterium]|jgi:preprotein translocase subunit SecE|nr:preprotein translocase subunit SecE [Candidatus Latescibacterota bacterium]
MYERAITFLKDVRAELVKVSWPSRDELVGSTTVVIVVSIVFAAFVGLVDFLLSILLSRFL